jgi:hypothetical protein
MFELSVVNTTAFNTIKFYAHLKLQLELVGCPLTNIFCGLSQSVQANVELLTTLKERATSQLTVHKQLPLHNRF